MENEAAPPEPLRTVELAGAPRAMGEAFGEQFREEIQDFARLRMECLLAHVRKHDPERDISREDVLALAGRTATAHEQFCPPIWEEFRGIGRGADLAVEELLIENGLTDFRDFVLFQNPSLRGGPAGHLGECTAFLVPGRLADGHPIVGQTWDMDAAAQRFLVVVHRKAADAPETLGLTTAGCLCLIGMNSEGVAVGNTNLVPTDARVGVNYLFTITNALRCRSADEAADAIEATPRLSGHNFYVADPQQAINVETTAQQSVRTVVEEEVFVHANHHLAESLKPLEFSQQSLANSRQRHDGLAAGFTALQPPITADACWQQLAHVVQTTDKATGVATCATVVLSPAARTLHGCAGAPRPTNRQSLQIGGA